LRLAATCHAQLPLSIPCLLLGCEQRMEGAVMGTSGGGLVTAAVGKCTDESVSSA